MCIIRPTNKEKYIFCATHTILIFPNLCLALKFFVQPRRRSIGNGGGMLQSPILNPHIVSIFCLRPRCPNFNNKCGMEQNLKKYLLHSFLSFISFSTWIINSLWFWFNYSALGFWLGSQISGENHENPNHNPYH